MAQSVPRYPAALLIVFVNFFDTSSVVILIHRNFHDSWNQNCEHHLVHSCSSRAILGPGHPNNFLTSLFDSVPSFKIVIMGLERQLSG